MNVAQFLWYTKYNDKGQPFLHSLLSNYQVKKNIKKRGGKFKTKYNLPQKLNLVLQLKDHFMICFTLKRTHEGPAQPQLSTDVKAHLRSLSSDLDFVTFYLYFLDSLKVWETENIKLFFLDILHLFSINYQTVIMLT